MPKLSLLTKQVGYKTPKCVLKCLCEIDTLIFNGTIWRQHSPHKLMQCGTKICLSSLVSKIHYIECLKSELLWNLDVRLLSHSQTVRISDSI